ncbi:hypothetical protein F383_16019 [Gossypium arboreum]|uniref:Uncharacterized protein n=1 Tax=Gossypium arboreum TaxID=29729 RepID=A0A0B0NF45_GOSAR|nr:hypothetical protein F383_16019 [Gossypium arboreum]
MLTDTQLPAHIFTLVDKAIWYA